MAQQITLASGSEVRQNLLRNAGVLFDIDPAKIDETALKEAMTAEQASPRDIADTLAEMKARRVASKRPTEIILGCDQVLAFQKQIFSKPNSVEDARHQLQQLQGNTHQLLSAAVIYENGEPVWRYVGSVRLTMRSLSEVYLEGYLERNWDSIRHSVGGYKLEEEGVRLFSQIQGDYFTVLGLPLLEVLAYLGLRGIIET